MGAPFLIVHEAEPPGVEHGLLVLGRTSEDVAAGVSAWRMGEPGLRVHCLGFEHTLDCRTVLTLLFGTRFPPLSKLTGFNHALVRWRPRVGRQGPQRDDRRAGLWLPGCEVLLRVDEPVVDEHHRVVEYTVLSMAAGAVVARLPGAQ